MYSHSHMGLMAGQQHPGNQWLPGGGGGWGHSQTGWTVATGGQKVKISVNSQQPVTIHQPVKVNIHFSLEAGGYWTVSWHMWPTPYPSHYDGAAVYHSCHKVKAWH